MSPSARITIYADDNIPLIGGTYTGGDNALHIIHKFGDHFCSKNLSFNADKSTEMLLNFGQNDVPLISGIDRKSSVELLASYLTKSWVLFIMWNASQNEPLPRYTLFFC